MKQYTDKDQTAKLMELGFPFPKSVIGVRSVLGLEDGMYKIEFEHSYSIGELIAFLGVYLMYVKPKHNDWFEVAYKEDYYSNTGNVIYGELIDKLFYACVKLKEEEVI